MESTEIDTPSEVCNLHQELIKHTHIHTHSSADTHEKHTYEPTSQPSVF